MRMDRSRALRGMASAMLAVACLLVAAGLVLAMVPGQPPAEVTVVAGTGHPPEPVADLAPNAPRISDVAATDISEKRATISWRTDEFSSCRVEFGETTAYGQSANSLRYATSHSVDLRRLSPGTTYHYRIIATGFWFSGTTQSGDYTFTTPGDGDDDGPPVISGISAKAITDSAATISWTTDKDADGQVEYGPTARYGSSTPLAPALTRSHSVALSGLSQGTVYHYRVKSKDAQGKLAQSPDRTFTTLAGAPLAITGMVVTDITTTGCTVAWTTTAPADTQVAYGLDTSYPLKTTRASVLEKAHRVTLTGLSPSTAYHCQAISRDAAGAVARSEDYQFVTVDDTPPVISGVIAVSISDNGAVITWTTDSPSEGSVEYGTTTSYGMVSSYDNTMVTSHRVTLSELAAHTVYHYKAKARDASGLWAESADCTFTTAIDMSADPPKIMYLTAARVSTSEATISWSTDELATTLVEYGETQDYGRRTQADAGLAMEHSIVLQELKSGVTYHYRVRCTDAAGNETVSSDRTFNTPIDGAPVPSLPVWAWAVIGVAGAAAVTALVLKNR